MPEDVADKVRDVVRQQQAILDVADPLHRLATLALLEARFRKWAEREAAAAIKDGESFASVARALGHSRQAVARKYGDVAPGRDA